MRADATPADGERRPGPGRFRWLLRVGVPLVFTVLGGVVFYRSLGSLSALGRLDLNAADLFAMFVAYAAFVFLRGLRFRLLLRTREPWLETAAVGALYSAATSVLPGGVGEFVLPVFYRRLPGGAARAIAAVAVARALDLLTWLPVVAVGFALGAVPRASNLLVALALLGTVLSVLAVYLPSARRLVVALVGRLPVPRAEAFAGTLGPALAEMAADVPAVLVTLGLRLTTVIAYTEILRGVGVPVTFAEAAVGGAVVAFLLALPVQGLAGFGTVEVWWISALRLDGVALPKAAAGALCLHVGMLLASILLALPFAWQNRTLVVREVSP